MLSVTLSQPGNEEATQLSAVLEIADSAMTYRSRYVADPDAARVLDLLLADERNPRSIGFQLATLFQHVRELRPVPDEVAETPEVRLATDTFSELRLLDVDSLARDREGGERTKLMRQLQRFIASMEDLSSLLTRTFLTHLHASRSWRGGTP
jgi:uncharacterized alpha-E superfamily protein